MLARTAATLAVGISAVSALSSSCSSFATNLALSSEGDCLNVAGLAPLVTLTSGFSIIPSVNSWLTGLCAITTPCSNDTLAAIGNNITTSCASDLEGLGLSSSTVAQIPTLLQQYYSVANEALCTRNTNSSDALCATSELTILQNSLADGTNLTTSNIISAGVGVLSNTTLETQLACTTCVQGMYAIIRPQTSSSLQSQIDGTLNGLCGSGFVTTTEPDGIIVATGSLATQTPTSSSKPGGAARTSAISSLSLSGALTVAAVVLGSVLVGAGSAF